MKATTKLELARVWIVSTKHISHDDANRLSSIPDITVTEYPEGFWVTVPPADDFDLKLLSARGLSDAFGHALSVAIDHRVEYLKIDADGPIYEFLAQFHW